MVTFRSRSPLAAIPPERTRKDRRRSPRVPLTVPAWIWCEKTSEPIAIQLFDESEHGMGFMSPVSLEPGQRFELALGREGVRRTSLRVKSCQSGNAGTFRMGAEA
jgi:hypothetical protein